MGKKRFVEAIVRTTITERAFVTYAADGSIEEYEAKDNSKIESVEEVKVLSEEEIEDELNDDGSITMHMSGTAVDYLLKTLTKSMNSTIFKREHARLSDLLFRLKTIRNNEMMITQEDRYTIVYSIREQDPKYSVSILGVAPLLMSNMISDMSFEYRSKFWDYDKKTDTYSQPFLADSEKLNIAKSGDVHE